MRVGMAKVFIVWLLVKSSRILIGSVARARVNFQIKGFLRGQLLSDRFVRTA